MAMHEQLPLLFCTTVELNGVGTRIITIFRTLKDLLQFDIVRHRLRSHQQQQTDYNDATTAKCYTMIVGHY